MAIKQIRASRILGEAGFTECVTQNSGFPPKWISWVRTCISTVSYSVLVNGKSYGILLLERGLRQGNLLSPYLFLLCTEVFGALIHKSEIAGLVQVVSVCRGSAKASVFSLQMVVFCFWGLIKSNAIMFWVFCKTTKRFYGRKLILKIFVFFSSKTTNANAANLKNVLGIQKVLQQDRYLGMPLMISKAKKPVFWMIK